MKDAISQIRNELEPYAEEAEKQEKIQAITELIKEDIELSEYGEEDSKEEN
jgi:hypothetical protein